MDFFLSLPQTTAESKMVAGFIWTLEKHFFFSVVLFFSGILKSYLLTSFLGTLRSGSIS